MHPPSNQDNHIHSVLIDEMRKIMAAYSNFKDMHMQTSPSQFSCMHVAMNLFCLVQLGCNVLSFRIIILIIVMNFIANLINTHGGSLI